MIQRDRINGLEKQIDSSLGPGFFRPTMFGMIIVPAYSNS